MRRRLIIIFFLLYSGIAYSQQVMIDSMKKVLKGQLPDSTRAMRMKDLAMYAETVDPAASERYYYEALAFAQQNKLDYEAGVIYQNLSFLYTAAAEYVRSIKVLDSALFFMNRAIHPKKTYYVANIHQLLSNAYRYNNQYKEAVKFSLQSIGEFEQLKMYG